MGRHQAATAYSDGMVQIVKRQAIVKRPARVRYQYVLSGSGHRAAADRMAANLAASGYQVARTEVADAVQLEYFTSQDRCEAAKKEQREAERIIGFIRAIFGSSR